MGFISYASHVSYEGDLKLIEWIKDLELIENARLLESFLWKIFVRIRLLIGDEKHIFNNGNNGTYFNPYFMLKGSKLIYSANHFIYYYSYHNQFAHTK